MPKQRGDRAVACLGAVIGAGFASGRELMTFFTQYGERSWWLMALTAGCMVLLSCLCMRLGCAHWCGLVQSEARPVRLLTKSCLLLLYGVTGGAMLSAAGELVALLLPIPFAFTVGLLASLAAAWWMARSGLKPLTGVSIALMALLLLCYVLLMSRTPQTQALPRSLPLWQGVVGAVAYAALNVTIGLEVICECADGSRACRFRTAALFGLLMLLMMFVGNALFLHCPNLADADMPLVALLNGMGREGYLLGVATLYCAVITSLASILRALNALFASCEQPALRKTAPILLILLFSVLGFAQIVTQWYAPVGLCCLAILLAPMLLRRVKP